MLSFLGAIVAIALAVAVFVIALKFIFFLVLVTIFIVVAMWLIVAGPIGWIVLAILLLILKAAYSNDERSRDNTIE